MSFSGNSFRFNKLFAGLIKGEAWLKAFREGNIEIVAESDQDLLLSAYSITSTGRRVKTPSATQVVAAGTTILPNAENVRVSCAADVTLIGTPTIAAGIADGQEILLMNVDSADAVTLQDVGTLLDSGLGLAANTIALEPFGSVRLQWNAAAELWIQISPITNMV